MVKLTRTQAIELLARAEGDDIAHALLCLALLEDMPLEAVVALTVDRVDPSEFTPRTRRAVERLVGDRLFGPVFVAGLMPLDVGDARAIVASYAEGES